MARLGIHRWAWAALALAALPAAGQSVGTTSAGSFTAVHGRADITSPGGSTVALTTTNGPGTSHSVLNWNSLDVIAGGRLTITQPSATSLSINRVVGDANGILPSGIFGTLSSNGRVVLVNPAGITFGAGAVVDTTGFIASTLSLSEADAVAGRLRFVAEPGGGAMVVNGLRASQGDVTLIAPQMDPARLQVDAGSLVLAAGREVEVTGPGLEGIVMRVQAPDNGIALTSPLLASGAVGVFAGNLRIISSASATEAAIEAGRIVLRASGDVAANGRLTATQGLRIEAGGDITLAPPEGGTVLALQGGGIDLAAQGRLQMDRVSLSATGPVALQGNSVDLATPDAVLRIDALATTGDATLAATAPGAALDLRSARVGGQLTTLGFASNTLGQGGGEVAVAGPLALSGDLALAGSLSPGGAGAIGQMVLGNNLVVQPGGRLLFDMDGPAHDRLVMGPGAQAVFNGPTSVALNLQATPPPGRYTLLSGTASGTLPTLAGPPNAQLEFGSLIVQFNALPVSSPVTDLVAAATTPWVPFATAAAPEGGQPAIVVTAASCRP